MVLVEDFAGTTVALAKKDPALKQQQFKPSYSDTIPPKELSEKGLKDQV
jgi:hypothetical protein